MKRGTSHCTLVQSLKALHFSAIFKSIAL